MINSSFDRGIGLIYINEELNDWQTFGLTFQINGSPKTWPHNWVWVKDRTYGQDDEDIPACWTYG